MRRRYTTAKRPKRLVEITARPKVGNVNFDMEARGEDGHVHIGEDWTICVAPRPIPGTVTWTDADTFPMFWSVTDPSSDFGPGFLERCEELDATEVVFVTREHVMKTTQAYYDEKWPGRVDVTEYEWDDVWRAFLRHAEREDR